MLIEFGAIVAAALLTVVVLAVIIWYFKGEIQDTIADQKRDEDLCEIYPWASINNYLATPVVAYYMMAGIWFVLASMRFGFIDRVDRHFDSAALSSEWLAPTGLVGGALLLFAVLPAIIAMWLASWLEKKYKNPNRGEKRSWGTEPHPSS